MFVSLKTFAPFSENNRIDTEITIFSRSRKNVELEQNFRKNFQNGFWKNILNMRSANLNVLPMVIDVDLKQLELLRLQHGVSDQALDDGRVRPARRRSLHRRRPLSPLSPSPYAPSPAFFSSRRVNEV